MAESIREVSRMTQGFSLYNDLFDSSVAHRMYGPEWRQVDSTWSLGENESLGIYEK